MDKTSSRGGVATVALWRFRDVLLVVTALLPLCGLLFYRDYFQFGWMIVGFGLAMVAGIAMAVLALAIALRVTFGPSNHKTIDRLAGGLLGLFFAVIGTVVAAAFVSNGMWGDTLNLGLVWTFVSNKSSPLDSFPWTPDQRFLFSLASVAVLVLFWAAIAFSVFSLTGSTLRWLTTNSAQTGKLMGRSLTPFVGAVVLLAICQALLTFRPQDLQGEPLSSFFQINPASSLLGMDSARMEAAIEDRAARANYDRAQKFDRKNVVVIVADALRADHMGVYGYERPTTPYLSRLLGEKRLHRVAMALSECSETFCGVAAILGSRHYFQASNNNFKLHELLKDVGYQTKFFLSGDHRTWLYLSSYYGPAADEIHDFKSWNGGDVNDDSNILASLAKLPASNGQPQYFHFHLMSSHVAGKKNEAYAKYKPDTVKGLNYLTFWNEIAGRQRVKKVVVTKALAPSDLIAIRNRYDNGVLQTDAVIDGLLTVLDQKGYLENSIVVIVGDHGDGLGEHGHVGHTRYLYQEDIRIPILIIDSNPELYKNSTFATHVDLAPTILERMGLKVPETWKGKSLLNPPVARMTIHQTRRGNTPCFAVVEFAENSLTKFIRCGVDNEAGGEFYDLLADPGEANSLPESGNIDAVRRARDALDNRFNAIVNTCTSKECVD